MPRIEEDVKVQKGFRDALESTHPAFGLVSVSEVTGRSAMFGSDIVHDRVLRVRVTTAKQDRHLSTDWNSSVETVVEFDMTHGQFAQFIASNSGRTVPVTLRRHRDGRAVNVPEIRMETAPRKLTQFREEVRRAVSIAAQRPIENLAALEVALQGATMSQKQRSALLALVTSAQSGLDGLDRNLGFVVESANEALEGIANEAKVSLEAYALQRLKEDAAAIPDSSQSEPIVLSKHIFLNDN